MQLTTLDQEPIKIFYAGLLGIAQGVLELCEKIDLNGMNVELHLFGDGAEKNQIKSLILSKNDQKIVFHDMVERAVLHEKIKSFDVAIVPLKNRIYGSVPSKIFEYSALGFPILYFGGGEGESIVLDNHIGWVAKVGDHADLNEKLKAISTMSKTALQEKKQAIFKTAATQFDLEKQVQALIDEGVF